MHQYPAGKVGDPGPRWRATPAGRARLVAAALAATLGAPLAAQDLRPGASDPGAPTIPRFAEPPPDSDWRLPPLDPAESAPLSARLEVFVESYRFSGNTVFDDTELQSIAAPYANRKVSSVELQRLRRELTLHYVNHGYINSGATLPDQRVDNGVVAFEIIEGRIGHIEVRGTRHLDPNFIRDRIAGVDEPVLRLSQLQDRLSVLLEEETVRRIGADLQPGERAGTSRLALEVEETPPWRLHASVANNRAPAVGAVRAQIALRHLSLSGVGDALTLGIGASEGAEDWQLRYQRPITPRWQLEFGVENSEASVVEETFEPLDIGSRLRGARFGLEYRARHRADETAVLGVTLEHRSSRTELLDDGFPFADGVGADGESAVSSLRLVQRWRLRAPTRVLYLDSEFGIGVDAMGASISDDAPDSRFLVWNGRLQWARRWPDGPGSVVLRADLRLADQALLPLEQCALGGLDSVRGYRVNQLVRDQCAFVSAEYRHRLPGANGSASTVQLLAFADYGRGWNRARPEAADDELPSLGLGLRWQPARWLQAEISWAHATRDFPARDHDLQDDGLGFRVQAELF